MNNPYFPLVVMFTLAAVVVLALLLIAWKVGPHSTNPAKIEPFESGNAPRGLPAPHPALHDAGHALASSHETRALMVRKPNAAVDSQANLSPQSVLSLLG